MELNEAVCIEIVLVVILETRDGLSNTRRLPLVAQERCVCSHLTMSLAMARFRHGLPWARFVAFSFLGRYGSYWKV